MCRVCRNELTRVRETARRAEQRLVPVAAEVDPDVKPALLPRITEHEKEWRQQALCAGTGLDWWREIGKERTHSTVKAALAVCARCPVRINCRDLGDIIEAPFHGLSHEDMFQAGIYGGETPVQRRRRRQRRNLKEVRKAVEAFIEERKLDKATLIGGYYTMQTTEGRRDFVEDLALKVVAINELIDEHMDKLAASEPEGS